MKKRIDLNCDLGEWLTEKGSAVDEAIMPFITSCNVACGGHIGDEESMQATILLANKYGVALGAHPSYPDRENFGRTVMDISSEKLAESLKSQIESFKSLVEKAGMVLHHIKPHGALYNHASIDEKTAKTILSVVKSIDPNIMVYLPENSISANVAQEFGLNVVYEVFADRAYENDLSLRDRSLEGAVLEDQADIIAQLRSMILKGEVLTHCGIYKSISSETVCLHSDTKGAIQLAETIHKFLTTNGVEITAA
tara:strand:- start:31342 stop:32100 length:759 start_codon:yes stop_codon:yes gene_type:complete